MEFQRSEILDLRDKLFNEHKKVNTLSLNIFRGITTGYNDAFIIDEIKKDQLIDNDLKSKNFIKPMLRGKDVKKYKTNYQNLYLLYIPWEFQIDEYNAIKEHLIKFKENLEKRPEVKNGRINWFSLSRYASDYYHEFEKDKIIWPEIVPKPYFSLDVNKLLLLDTVRLLTSEDDSLNLKYLMAILNSNLLFWLFKQISPQIEGKRLRYKKQYVEQLPIYPATEEQQKPFIEKADLMLQLNKDLMNEINSFKHWLQLNYNLEKFSKKLDKYYELDLNDFLKELKKKKLKLKPKDIMELEEEFNLIKIE